MDTFVGPSNDRSGKTMLLVFVMVRLESPWSGGFLSTKSQLLTRRGFLYFECWFFSEALQPKVKRPFRDSMYYIYLSPR